MKKLVILALSSTLALLPLAVQARNLKLPGRLPTKLSPSDLEGVKADEKNYPHLMKYLENVDVSKSLVKSDPRNAAVVATPYVFQPTRAMWKGFFENAIADHMTFLHALGMLAREIKRNGVVVFGPGVDFEGSVTDNHVDMGLAMPATHIGTAIWSPDPKVADPEFDLHFKIFYTEPYIHRFPDDILDANLKIGYGPVVSYWMNGTEYTQPTIDADIYDGPHHGIGFFNVHGIKGQKRGFLGVLQKILFIPEAIHAMYIDEKSDDLVTDAFINTRVHDFERTPKYGLSIKN